MRFFTPLPLVLAFASALGGACARVNSSGNASPGGPGGPSGGSDAMSSMGGSDVATRLDGGTFVTTSVCGNGQRTSDEACDDGNTVAADGCAANCLTVESGYSCVPVGRPCHRIARCGDGVVVLPELCDDGNQVAGDGCSSTCKTEVGYRCSGSPSACTPTTCGDNLVEGAESCDQGDAMPFDGCSSECQSEPNCATGACMSRCGDGIVVGEACDDGNNIGGDGCAADCKIERGFQCRQPALGDKMNVPIVYRDFRAHNPTDFEPGAIGRIAALPGMVAANLDADGKPTFTGLAGSLIASQNTFSQWYRNVPGVNHATASKLALWNNSKGAYVNRSGPNGEQWQKTLIANWCGTVGMELNGVPCTFLYGDTDCQRQVLPMLKCYIDTDGTTYKALYLVDNIDGNPLFFPVDGDPFTPPAERSPATISELYAQYLTAEPGMLRHNFGFTSEVRYWFQYDASKTYTLDFTGDDDVWVFINKKLAVDLGGIHVSVQGSVTLNATSAPAFGLRSGEVYEVAVFQAERQTTGSSYRLTLGGFSAAPSECVPICGDGILGIGEECDDGVNPGGYGQCGPDCKLSEYCGDGIVQAANEDCDDGVNNGHPCPSGCRVLVIP
jgi:fibro-slime domain-containing protein